MFVSNASNLDPSDDDGGTSGQDVFIRFRSTGELRTIPTPMGWAIQPTVSGDGRFVAFASFDPSLSGTANNQIVLHELATGTNEVVSVSSTGRPADRGSSLRASTAPATSSRSPRVGGTSPRTTSTAPRTSSCATAPPAGPAA